MARVASIVKTLMSIAPIVLAMTLSGCASYADQSPTPSESFMTASPDHFDARGIEIQQQVRNLIPDGVLDFSQGAPPPIGEATYNLQPCGPSLDQDTWSEKSEARYYYDSFTVPLKRSQNYEDVFQALNSSIESETSWNDDGSQTIGDKPIPDSYWISEDDFHITISLSRGDKERNSPDLIYVGVASPCFIPSPPYESGDVVPNTATASPTARR